MRYFFSVFILFLVIGNVFSQSKKEQIEMLNKRVDSLITLNTYERNDKTKIIAEFNTIKLNLENSIINLNSTIEKLNEEVNIIQSDLNNKQSQINTLLIQIKIKSDSILTLNDELEKLKEVEKERKESNPELILTEIIQIGPYKSVKIGEQIWMTQNLNVAKFRNGDLIPEVQSQEEWESAEEKEQPAWCYMNNDSSNGEKYGKLYNWYAVIDQRGLAPEGWHIPRNSEWDLLISNLGGKKKAGVKMSLPCEEYYFNATNSSGFSALPSGARGPDPDHYMLNWWGGTYWYSFESNCYHINEQDGKIDDEWDMWGKGDGLSVRCVKN